MKRSATFVLSLTIYLLFAAAASHAQTASQSALVEGAKKEGKLVWYTSMAIDTSKPLLDAFVKEYPFIKADLVRAGEEQLMNRVLSETRAAGCRGHRKPTSQQQRQLRHLRALTRPAPASGYSMPSPPAPWGRLWTGT